MRRHLKLRALVLRLVDYGESDRVVTLLTAERGKLAAFARGARASRRRFGGALEPFALLRVEAVERPGRELLSLEAVQVERAFGGIRADLARIACAGYASELSRELVRDAEPHPGLFDLLVRFLAGLDAGPATAAGLRAFELGALRAAGLAPRLDSCARCGGVVPERGRLPFDPGRGGILCPGCAPAAGPGALEMAAPTARALARLRDQVDRGSAAGDLDPAAAREGRRCLTAFIEHHLGRSLPSRRFLDEVGPALRGAP